MFDQKGSKPKGIELRVKELVEQRNLSFHDSERRAKNRRKWKVTVYGEM